MLCDRGGEQVKPESVGLGDLLVHELRVCAPLLRLQSVFDCFYHCVGLMRTWLVMPCDASARVCKYGYVLCFLRMMDDSEKCYIYNIYKFI